MTAAAHEWTHSELARRNGELLQERDELRLALNRAEEREAMLVGALRPFAREAVDNWSARALANTLPLTIILPDSRNEYRARFSMADIQRAAAALSQVEQAKKEGAR